MSGLESVFAFLALWLGTTIFVTWLSYKYINKEKPTWKVVIGYLLALPALYGWCAFLAGAGWLLLYYITPWPH